MRREPEIERAPGVFEGFFHGNRRWRFHYCGCLHDGTVCPQGARRIPKTAKPPRAAQKSVPYGCKPNFKTPRRMQAFFGYTGAERRRRVPRLRLSLSKNYPNGLDSGIRVMDYEWQYDRLTPYYCHDNGRPGTDPVVLIKMVLIQHLFGIPSLRQT